MSGSASPPRIKPPRLRAGDRVGIVAPASHFKRQEFEAGSRALAALGYEPVYDEEIFARDFYFAGSAERRARELEQMFLRPDVRAVVCARGGYGANYLLPLLDLAKIAAHPKIFVGYSDNTFLLTHLSDRAGLVTFHGPMVAKDFAQPDGVELDSFRAALTGEQGWQLDFQAASRVKPLGTGSAEGLVYGGCLSMLAASLGTPYQIETRDTILFIEDLSTKPYQVDRMLMQLRLAGKLEGVRGFIFGEMLDCVQPGDQDFPLEDVIRRVIGDLGVPIAYGVPSGHVSRRNMTLPIGVRARLTVDRSTVALEFLEAATAV
jgi:muramoyltetrapeptide carboxypeptidase